MKTLPILLALFFCIGIISCEEDKKDTYPSCMQKEIDEFMSNTHYNEAAIEKCSYKNKVVYIFYKYVANEKIKAVDKDCNTIATCVTGGVAGPNPCADEFKYIETVWRYSKLKK